MSRDSSFGKGFGWGCGLYLGVTAAQVFLVIFCLSICCGVPVMMGLFRQPNSPEAPEPPQKPVVATPVPKKPDQAEPPLVVRNQEQPLPADDPGPLEKAFRQEEQAADKLREADALREQNPAAYKQRLEAILDQHPTTETASRATALVAEAERLMGTEREREENEKKAAALLVLAQSLTGKPLAVKERLERIVKEYPETKAAEEARRMLKAP